MIWPGRPNHDIEGWDLFSKNPVSRHTGILFDLLPYSNSTLNTNPIFLKGLIRNSYTSDTLTITLKGTTM